MIRRGLMIIMCLMVILSMGGVYATWKYAEVAPLPAEYAVEVALAEFEYGDVYITKIERVDTSGTNIVADLNKTDDTTVSGNIDLGNSRNATATFEITFYNNTDITYYYHEAETLISSNSNIIYEVGDIEKTDPVYSHNYRTITVTYSYNTNNITNTELESSIFFKFVIDKSDIEIVVAKTAVDRFKDILNNVVYDNSYDILDTAMDNRAGWNASSDVTYIGNVSGSSDDDSEVIGALFGAEFMSMDLDGDGVAEPITMMIKREDLDGDSTTGTSYTYTSNGRSVTVDGVEMTLYITAQSLDNVRSGQEITVYAATFTIYSDGTEWVEVVPLTKGTAKANNYNGWGSANSFNTDTWESDDGKTMDELVIQYIKQN